MQEAILKKGSSGALVLTLQKLLNKYGKLPQPIAETSKFDDETFDAVRSFQKRIGIAVDGKVGKETAGGLAKLAGPSAASFAHALGSAPDSGETKSAGPKATLNLNGKTYQVDKAEYDASKEQLLDKLRRTAVVGALQRSNAAREMWNYFDSLNKEQYVVSFLIGSRFCLPNENIIKQGEAAYKHLKEAVDSGDCAKVRDALKTSADPINKAYETMLTYKETTTGVAEDGQAKLEFVRDKSFAVVEAYATVVLGGTPVSGALASGAGEFVKSATGELSKYANNVSQGGMNAGWNIALDTFGGAGSGFLSGLMPAVAKGMVGKAGAKFLKKVGGKFLEEYILKTIEGAGKQAIEKAFETALKQLKTNPRMDKVELVKMVIEEAWNGLKLGALFGGLDAWIDNKFADKVYDSIKPADRLKFFGQKLMANNGKDARKVLEDILESTKGVEEVRKALTEALDGARGSENAEAIGSAAANRFVTSGLRTLSGEIARRAKAESK